MMHGGWIALGAFALIWMSACGGETRLQLVQLFGAPWVIQARIVSREYFA